MTNNFLDEHQVLLETLLPTEWTWGCELECIMPSDLYYEVTNEDYDDNYDDVDYSRLNDYFIETLNDCMPEHIEYNYDSSDVHGDGSVHPTLNSDVPMEWASPVFKARPEYFQGFIKFLKTILYNGVYTNDTCGFHHHLMFNGMTERDAVWIYCNLAMDTEFLKQSGEFEDLAFVSHWASDDVFTTIRKGIQQGNFDLVLSELNTDKYRLFRLHPEHGTLEWRGPRDFLNNGEISSIKHFYYDHLQVVIKRFIEYNKMKTLFDTNISKQEFFNKLTEARKNDTTHSKRYYGTNEFITKTNIYPTYKIIQIKILIS